MDNLDCYLITCVYKMESMDSFNTIKLTFNTNIKDSDKYSDLDFHELMLITIESGLQFLDIFDGNCGYSELKVKDNAIFSYSYRLKIDKN